MSQLVLERKKISVSIYGKSFELLKPTVKQAKQLQVMLKDVKPGDELQVFQTFFETLGIPSDILEEMDVEHFIQLSDFVLALKKN